MSMQVRLAVLVLLCLGSYWTAFGNGFAYDDNPQILRNPVVQNGDLGDILTTPYWPTASRGSGLYRPTTTAVLALQWAWFGDQPFGYHVVNVLLHLLNTILVWRLARWVLSEEGALAGAALFAVHPVHAEAVANVVGVSELLVAALVLSWLLVVRNGIGPRPGESERRVGSPEWRLGALVLAPVVFLLAVGAKENGVVAIPLLLLLGWQATRHQRSVEDVSLSGFKSLTAQLPVVLVLLGVFGLYLMMRYDAVGAIAGDAPAPELRGLTSGQRLLTGVSLLPEYLRLMVFPLDLSADYGPAVLLPALAFDGTVLLGALVGGALLFFGARDLSRGGGVGFGIGWFFAAVLPVSHLLVPAGTLLAERTLYLPSVGACIALGALFQRVWSDQGNRQRLVLGVGAVVVLAMGARTAVRNPSWNSTFDMYRVLHRDHPESFLAQRARAGGLAQAGEAAAAAEAYRLAIELSPRNYSTLSEAGEFFGRQREWATGDSLLRQAIEETPSQPLAYRLLSAQAINRGEPGVGALIAARGLATTLDDAELWWNLAAAYARLGEVAAAERAAQQVIRLTRSEDQNAVAERVERLLNEARAVEAGREF